MFFDEIYITFNNILDTYNKILLACDLNIDELKPGSNSWNHLSEAKDIFKLTNLVKKPTCSKSEDGTPCWLNPFVHNAHFLYPPENIIKPWKPYRFLMFSGLREIVHWERMG